MTTPFDEITDEQIQASIDAEIAAAGFDPVTLEPTVCFST